MRLRLTVITHYITLLSWCWNSTPVSDKPHIPDTRYGDACKFYTAGSVFPWNYILRTCPLSGQKDVQHSGEWLYLRLVVEETGTMYGSVI